MRRGMGETVLCRINLACIILIRRFRIFKHPNLAGGGQAPPDPPRRKKKTLAGGAKSNRILAKILDFGENFGFGFTFVLNTGEAERNSRNVRSQALTILPASPVINSKIQHAFGHMTLWK